MIQTKYLGVLLVIGLFFTCAKAPAPKVISEEVSKPKISPESFLLYKNFPSQYTDARNVEIWLPKQYDTTAALPVLYMFDGQNIFHGTAGWSGEYNEGWQVDEVLDSLIGVEAIPPVIVVGIWNGATKRGAEYMPAKPKDLLQERIAATEHDWYKHLKETPPESDEHLQFVVHELKPFVDANFKTKKDRANTFVAGSSMGGLMASYAICEYPNTFGGAACFSTHWLPLDGVFLEYFKDNLPDPATHRLWFDYGTETLDAEYEPFQRIADQALVVRGFEKEKNWVTRKFEGAAHHEKDWHDRFHLAMIFLFD